MAINRYHQVRADGPPGGPKGESGTKNTLPPRSKLPLRAEVHIPKDLPITQIEIEVIAALLDDWETVVPDTTEAAE